MLWKNRIQAEKTYQNLLIKSFAQFSRPYSVSQAVSNCLESFKDSVFTESRTDELLGYAVDCPVDVQVFDEHFTPDEQKPGKVIDQGAIVQKYSLEYTITELPASIKENGMRYFECIRCGDTYSNKISSQYYHVAYRNNKAVGMASAIIILKGRYTGTVKKTFRILPRGTSLKGKILADENKFIVRWKKQTVQVDGYQIQYSENMKFANTKSRIVNDCKKTKIIVKKQKPGKRYYVRVRTYKKVNGKKYFSKWSKIKVEK